jgi:hypothetical protein
MVENDFLSGNNSKAKKQVCFTYFKAAIRPNVIVAKLFVVVSQFVSLFLEPRKQLIFLSTVK